MSPIRSIDSTELEEFIILHQDFLRPKFPEPKITSKRGRPRIGLRWVMIAICVYARNCNITWEALPHSLVYCDFLVEKGYLRKLPAKSTFHGSVSKAAKKNTWIIQKKQQNIPQSRSGTRIW